MRQFGAEAIGHADRSRTIRLHQRMGEIEALQNLLHTDAPVDQVNLEVSPPQNAVFELELVGRNDLRFAALLAKEIAEDLELAGGGGEGGPELQDRDLRLAAPSEVFVRRQQRRKKMLLSA